MFVVVALVVMDAFQSYHDDVIAQQPNDEKRTNEEPTVSQQWAEVISTASYEGLDVAVVEKVVLTLADSIGVMTYTSNLDEVRRFHEIAVPGGRAEATEFVTGRRVPLQQAAAANAFAIHGHEIDDSNLRNQLRASCIAIPAPLAVAEHASASGKDFILALAISYQLSDRLATFTNLQPQGDLHRRGMMPSSVCGVVGAAAASGKLLQLERDQLVSAIGIAAGGANGLFQYYRDGSEEKKIHVARSQRMAVESALLARADFVGAHRSIEGRYGLLEVFGFKPEREKLLESFGKFDGIMHVKPKFYSCSQGVIPWLEALEPVIAKREFAAADIDKIIIGRAVPTSDYYLKKINDFRGIRTLIDAQLSVNFGIALYLVKGDAFINEYTLGSLGDSKVLALAHKVVAQSDPRAKTKGFITVVLRSGEEFTGEYPVSNFYAPYAPVRKDYRRKFDRLTSRLSTSQRDRLWNHVMQVSDAKDVALWSRRLAKLMYLSSN